jgi:hypothetical protein
MLAVAQSLLVSNCHMLRDQVPSQDMGPEHFDRLHAPRLRASRGARLKALGFEVQLTPAS